MNVPKDRPKVDLPGNCREKNGGWEATSREQIATPRRGQLPKIDTISNEHNSWKHKACTPTLADLCNEFGKAACGGEKTDIPAAKEVTYTLSLF